jgi:hypothetical protein
MAGHRDDGMTSGEYNRLRELIEQGFSHQSSLFDELRAGWKYTNLKVIDAHQRLAVLEPNVLRLQNDHVELKDGIDQLTVNLQAVSNKIGASFKANVRWIATIAGITCAILLGALELMGKLPSH